MTKQVHQDKLLTRECHHAAEVPGGCSKCNLPLNFVHAILLPKTSQRYWILKIHPCDSFPRETAAMKDKTGKSFVKIRTDLGNRELMT